MAGIRVPVGAVSDRSLSTAFEPLVAAMARAKQQVETMSKAMASAQKAAAKVGTDAMSREADRAAAAAERAFAKMEADAQRLAQREIAAADRAAQGKVRAEQRAFDAKIRLAQQEAAAFERNLNKEIAAADRAAARHGRISTRESAQNRRGLYDAAAGLGMRALSGAGQVAQGMGVDMTIGGTVSRAVTSETLATRLSQSAYTPELGGAAAVRQDPKVLVAEARQVAMAVGMSTNDALEGLVAFTGKTGDLAKGRAILKDMAELSAATGTSMSDMISAAGAVANALGESDKSGDKLKDVMKTVAAQGKLGAVEISDLAVQMDKIAAAGGAFEGDIAMTLKSFGGLAQMARARGGATSAAEAGTAISNFVNQLRTPARVGALKEAGIDVYNERGQMRDPMKIIRQAIEKYGSDPTAFSGLFKDIRGSRGPLALVQTYQQAEAREKGSGMKAVDAEIAKFQNVSMDAAQIQQNLAGVMETTASKTNVFNNKMEVLAAGLVERILPAFESLAPVILTVAGLMVDMGVVIGKVLSFFGVSPSAAGGSATPGAPGKGKSPGSPGALGKTSDVINKVTGSGEGDELAGAGERRATAALIMGAVGGVIGSTAGMPKLGMAVGAGVGLGAASLAEDQGRTKAADLNAGILETESGGSMRVGTGHADIARGGGIAKFLANMQQNMAKGGVAGDPAAPVKIDPASNAPVVSAIESMAGKTLNVNIVGGLPDNFSGAGDAGRTDSSEGMTSVE